MQINKYKDIFDFWQHKNLESLKDGAKRKDVHKDDKRFISAKIEEEEKKKANISFQFNGRVPSPWDGNLREAKIVICYANPASNDDHLVHRELMLEQLSGNAPLPTDIPEWKDWYENKKFSTLQENFDRSDEICVFNLCPYASLNMSDVNWRVASCLPSIWWAQKHLREVLIPDALNEKIFLVIARAHQRWGIQHWGEIDSFREGNLRIQNGRGGYIREDIACDFKKWKLRRTDLS
ncbi:hypothetical protein N9F57_02715 [Gammaproteobacteria bacterium]|nr:hypothetical protein [Gammaproteobacteria bacterium]